MHAGVHLGVVIGPLGHAPQAVQLGQQAGEGAAVAQHLEHARGPGLHQAARQLLPDALWHQGVHFALCHHLAHQRCGFRRNGEIMKTCGKACQAQDAHRVFAIGKGHMA
ncbi:hypothetical protein D3C81_2051060 [compost metagenome]